MAKNDFQYGGWNSYTLQCGTIMILISPSDCTLQFGMWLWGHGSEFTKWQQAYPAKWHVALGWHVIEFARWQHPAMLHVALESHDSQFSKWQHPAMWYVALRWHAIEFVQISAILEFHFWFRFRPYHRSRHVILHQSAKFYQNRTTLSRKKWRHVDFPDGGSSPSCILGPIMGSLQSPRTTSYRLLIEIIALNRLVFEKIAFLHFLGRTDRQTNRWTDPLHEVASGGLTNWRTEVTSIQQHAVA